MHPFRFLAVVSVLASRSTAMAQLYDVDIEAIFDKAGPQRSTYIHCVISSTASNRVWGTCEPAEVALKAVLGKCGTGAIAYLDALEQAGMAPVGEQLSDFTRKMVAGAIEARNKSGKTCP